MATAEVHANDDAEDLQLNQMIRPCVDCGRYTGGYCVGVRNRRRSGGELLCDGLATC